MKLWSNIMKTSLATLIRDLLASRDLAAASRLEATFIAHRPNDENLPYIDQLRAMNYFWRVQLGSLEVCTIEERECLTDDGLLHDYLRNFEECVLPTVLRHQLPFVSRV